MRDMMTMAVSHDAPSIALTERQREQVPAALSYFLDTIATTTGRATFYNSREEQESTTQMIHEKLFDASRDVYTAALLLPGVTDYSRQLGIMQLLRAPATRESAAATSNLPLEYEAVAISRLVRELPAQRMLKLFGWIQRERINNVRTRRLILSEILSTDRLELWAVKYRTKLRRALTHAWGRRTSGILRSVIAKCPEDRDDRERQMVSQNLSRYARIGAVAKIEQCVRFILGDERDLTLPRLTAYHDAKVDFARGVLLPTETMEGLRSRFHKDRSSAEVLELTKSNLTRGQKIAVQRQADRSGVEVDFDPLQYDPVRLYVYAYEMGMSDQIRDALREMAQAVAVKLPFQFQRAGVLVDASQSMVGHETQAKRPIATALALRDVLVEISDESLVLTSDRQVMDAFGLVEPSGDTSLALGLVELLKTQPDVIFVITDGYENAPAGRFHQTVEAVRRIGIQTPIHQLSPVFAAESHGVRALSDSITALPVSKPEGISLGLLKALIESDVDQGVLALMKMTTMKGLIPNAS